MLNDKDTWKWDFTLGPILSREISLAISYILELISYGFNEVFLIILIKHLLLGKYFLFSQCGFLSGPNYVNLYWKLHFSKNLQDVKFKNILSLRHNHCGLWRATKTSKFFSHSFSQYNSEKLIRTLSFFCF